MDTKKILATREEEVARRMADYLERCAVQSNLRRIERLGMFDRSFPVVTR